MNEELYHHGILGMHWGIRRYQNPDGTYTDLGKKRLSEGKELNEKGREKLRSDLKTVANDLAQAFVNGQIDPQHQEKNKEIMDAYMDKWGDTPYSDLKIEWKDRIEDGQMYTKAVVRSIDEIGLTHEIAEGREYKIPNKIEDVKASINKTVKDEDYHPDFLERSDKDTQDRWASNAALGLKALVKMNEFGSESIDYNDKGEQDWFLFEDQTIGMSTVASMINRGVPVEDVKKLIKDVENSELTYGYGDERDPNPVVDHFAFDVREGNYQNKLIEFAEACDDVKRNK